jgi:S1-C subfamily serine protease
MSSTRAVLLALAVALLLAAGWLFFGRTPAVPVNQESAPPPASSSRSVAAPRPTPVSARAAEPETLPESVPALPDPEPDAPLSIEEIVSRSLPAVVTVETRGGSGSGFFVSRDTVLTNYHVLQGARAVTLRTSSGGSTAASVVTASPELDLAVLKADIVSHDQATLPLGEPSDVRIGAEVLAIGSPLGLRNTVTRGIVSSIRDVRGVHMVQTDAAINPGNSGGPLIDRTGRVIGVNTLKVTGGATESIGFAVSVQHTRTLLGSEFTAPSVAQRGRDLALRKYDNLILRLAKLADGVEQNWRTFKPQCYHGNAEVAADREWLALSEGPPPILKSLPRCKTWMPYFTDWSQRMQTALSLYERSALEAGVNAARLREVRDKYGMTVPSN